jgi:hypothetical protein
MSMTSLSDDNTHRTEPPAARGTLPRSFPTGELR